MNDIIWSPGVTLEALEKQAVLRAFRHFRGNKTATAQALGIAIRTLDNKLERYELDSKQEKERQDHESIQRADFLARSRGPKTPNYINGDPSQDASAGWVHSHAGARVESAPQPAAQPAVPVPQRQEVQRVLPKQAAASGPHRNR